jgi:hypothetical protein
VCAPPPGLSQLFAAYNGQDLDDRHNIRGYVGPGSAYGARAGYGGAGAHGGYGGAGAHGGYGGAGAHGGYGGAGAHGGRGYGGEEAPPQEEYDYDDENLLDSERRGAIGRWFSTTFAGLLSALDYLWRRLPDGPTVEHRAIAADAMKSAEAPKPAGRR